MRLAPAAARRCRDLQPGGGGRSPASRAPTWRTVSAEILPNSWISFATSPVQPVWWLAPMPAPLSPWKYS